MLDTMRDASRVVLACVWAGWLAYWLISASKTKRTIERGGFFGYRLVMVGVTLALVGVFRVFGQRPVAMLWQAAAAPAIACVLLAVAGAAFAIWARIVLGRNWSAEITFKQDHELIETGPYALVRHPIYTGILAMALGTALNLGRPIGISLLVGLCVSFWWKARGEERIMISHFPQYARYRARVPAIIPFLL
jgi:protein-S-isoprenylcysteine O-methyltransferase Ste14